MITIPDGTSHHAPRGGIRTVPVLPALVLAVLLCGCGEKDEMVYPSTNLGGQVSLDMVPISDGMIAFGSMDPKVGAVVVTKILRGRYIADKVPLGSVRVYISSFKDAGPGKPRVSIIPPRYQTGIALEVTRNSSRVDFQLVTDEEADAAAAAAAAAERARSGSDVAAGADVDTASEPKPAGAEPESEPGSKSEPGASPPEPETPESQTPASPGPNWG